MITVRRSGERGHFDHGWLQTWHTFSFAGYHDAQQMGWSVLRVINEDIVAPGQGFGMHGHRDMEILTWILEGTLEHKDSMGNGTQICPGEAQRMSAGSGVRHSEFNPAADAATHLLQIWIEPATRDIAPGYEQMMFPEDVRRARLCLIASPDGREGSVTIHQDARVFTSLLFPGESVRYTLASQRRGYLHVARGEVSLKSQSLQHGDGAKISDESGLEVIATQASEILLFDLP